MTWKVFFSDPIYPLFAGLLVAMLVTLGYVLIVDLYVVPKREKAQKRQAEITRLKRKAAEAEENELEVRKQYANAQATLDILNMMGASAHDARVELIREAYKAGQRGD